jgi:glycosyltransferase involved in cell wall biosynthesis
MEAMASGLAVVGTEVNGIAELVEHGRTGLLVPPASPDGLAASLWALIESPETRRSFGEAGRVRIVERFSVERMVSAKEDLFLSLAGRA